MDDSHSDLIALFILSIGAGIILMASMTLFITIVAVALVVVLALSPWIVRGFLESWRERP